MSTMSRRESTRFTQPNKKDSEIVCGVGVLSERAWNRPLRIQRGADRQWETLIDGKGLDGDEFLITLDWMHCMQYLPGWSEPFFFEQIPWHECRLIYIDQIALQQDITKKIETRWIFDQQSPVDVIDVSLQVRRYIFLDLFIVRFLS